MKQTLVIALATALAVSLWFNWQKPASRNDVVPAPPGVAEAATPVLPPELQDIDFSDTGLADAAWQLTSPKLEEKIPLVLPGPEVEGTTLPLPARDDWKPNANLNLESRPP